MKIFPRPENLNAIQLLEELTDAGFIGTRVADYSDGTIGIDLNKDGAESIVANHNGLLVAPEPTIEEKLASVGLKISDLKAALGL